jgi:5'-nucleotidase
MPFGPLHRFFVEIASLQGRESTRSDAGSTRTPSIRTAIITARNAPAHERVVTTLRSWGMQVDEAFFLGGMEKAAVLKAFKPHLFFDDQLAQVTGAAGHVPCAHVPFGIANRAGRIVSHASPLRKQSGTASTTERHENKVPA